MDAAASAFRSRSSRIPEVTTWHAKRRVESARSRAARTHRIAQTVQPAEHETGRSGPRPGTAGTSGRSANGPNMDRRRDTSRSFFRESRFPNISGWRRAVRRRSGKRLAVPAAEPAGPADLGNFCGRRAAVCGIGSVASRERPSSSRRGSSRSLWSIRRLLDWDREQRRLHEMNVAAVFGGEDDDEETKRIRTTPASCSDDEPQRCPMHSGRMLRACGEPRRFRHALRHTGRRRDRRGRSRSVSLRRRTRRGRVVRGARRRDPRGRRTRCTTTSQSGNCSFGGVHQRRSGAPFPAEATSVGRSSMSPPPKKSTKKKTKPKLNSTKPRRKRKPLWLRKQAELE